MPLPYILLSLLTKLFFSHLCYKINGKLALLVLLSYGCTKDLKERFLRNQKLSISQRKVLWNPDSWALELEIQRKESGISLMVGSWIPTSTDKGSGRH